MAVPERFILAAQRASKSVVQVISFEDRPFLGTAVLLTVAGRWFLLTAGHNLTSDGGTRKLQLDQVAVAYPRDDGLELPVAPGAGGIWGFQVADDLRPDVAYVELDPAAAVRWRHLEPRTLDDLISVSEIRDDDDLVLVGFPRAFSTVEEVAGTPRVALVGQCIRARLRTDFEGKSGIFVLLDGDFEDAQGVVSQLPNTSGMKGISGGPVFRVDGERVQVLALASSILEPSRYQRCEPAYEAARLLLSHEDPGVVGEARRLLVRLGVDDAARSTSPRKSP